jgi:hypothetical protein
MKTIGDLWGIDELYLNYLDSMNLAENLEQSSTILSTQNFMHLIKSLLTFPSPLYQQVSNFPPTKNLQKLAENHRHKSN